MQAEKGICLYVPRRDYLMNMVEKEVVVKDLVTKSNLPASDYVINPRLPSWVQVLLCLFYEAVYESW